MASACGKGCSVLKDRTTAAVVFVAVIGIVIMGAALFVSSRSNQAGGNLDEGAAYMATNAQEAGVQTTASGLQYEVITQGDGERPTADDTVLVHYRGTLTDGTEFDSSYSRNQPISFPLRNVIAGWTEGVQLMPVGSTYRFTIPPNLAYGERGVPGVIPPNSTLIFDVELLEIL